MKNLLSLLLALSAWTIHAQSTNAPRFQTPLHKDATTPVVLRWDGDPRAIYKLEWSTTLTSNSWQTAVENFPSQGSNTWFADMGIESERYPRISTADSQAAHRFYRLSVESIMSNIGLVSVSISNVSGGAVLTGITNIVASGAATQGVISATLYLDGKEVETDFGDSYVLPIDTRYFPNGEHRLSVTVQDGGGRESTEIAGSPDLGPTYGVSNIMVTVTNDLSNVRLRYTGYRPESNQVQEISASWSSPRTWRVDISPATNLAVVYRSFAADNPRILIAWDGKDTNGAFLNPQRLMYQIYDLGVGTNSGFASGGTANTNPPPGFNGFSMQAAQFGGGEFTAPLGIYPPTMQAAILGLDYQTFSALKQATPTEFQFSTTSESSASSAMLDSAIDNLGAAAAGGTLAMAFPGLYKIVGTIGFLHQGHHPKFGSYSTPTRGPALGNVRMSSGRQFGPWDKLKSPRVIANDATVLFPPIGYYAFQKGDDAVTPGDLRKTSVTGGSNILNQFNIGVFIGHSVAGRDAEISLGHLQSYVPIYNSAANSMTFVKAATEMQFGSTNLKWMCFYSCNLLRDEYRANPIYSQMKNAFHLPMNGRLHILQAYATEMSVHHGMAKVWTKALSGRSPLRQYDTVIGAWQYVCLETQPKESDNAKANYSRSVYWPECVNDYIYGYGPQTDPSRSPSDPTEQANLLEDDQRAPQ